MPERDIRKALKKRVEAYGGEQRAMTWLGRRNAPDVLTLFPYGSAYGRRYPEFVGAYMHPLVECKAPGGVPTPAQEREHERLRKAAFVVWVISTFEQLDAWLPAIK